jgi:hypothetical protein
MYVTIHMIKTKLHLFCLVELVNKIEAHCQDKGAEGRGRIARRQRRLLLVDVEKRLMEFQACMDRGMVCTSMYST